MRPGKCALLRFTEQIPFDLEKVSGIFFKVRSFFFTGLIHSFQKI